MADDKSGGVLFQAKDKRAKNWPDWRGNLTLNKDDLKFLVKCANEGKELKLELAAWHRRGEKAGLFLSLTASQPREDKPREDRPREPKREKVDDPFGDGLDGDDIPF